ncbi:hypothetical protein BU15DRAFT_68776 [Melanogaster broomeanus]|nr:hypothetical protein BU15DRAFT_68776 [Melanogaster broomeanus]
MSSNEVTDQQELDALFPVPSLPPSPLSPQRFPGSGLESVAALQRVLKDNHNRYHIFFNYTHFHDHVGYRALAIYALGGSASLIKDYYEQDGKNQRLAVKSPGPITEGNFVEHLGDENSQNIVGSFYQGYVTFFSKQIDEKGRKRCDEATRNAVSLDGWTLSPHDPRRLRIEFGLKGMLAEGLALCAVEAASERGLYPPSPFVPIPTAEVHGTGPPVFNAQPATAAILSKIGGVHAFNIIAHMLKDDQLKPKAGTQQDPRVGKDAHAYLSPRSGVSLLRAYFTTVLTWWVARGRLALNFQSFMAASPLKPTVKAPPTIEATRISNPFLPIIQSIQRAFAHFNTLYGLRPPGYFAGTELEGAELLDGSLFVRAAVLTADSLEWVREGPEADTWNMEGVHKQQL